jgi:serine-type D-Ala-D-Ala carboxypeptidase/endopeptidase (penicillin-binding protein 4)
MRRICLLLALATGGWSTFPATADELPEPIQRALAGLGVPEESVSLLVRQVGRTEPVLSHLPEQPRNPASVMKLVTTFSALELLGPAYTWRTEAYFGGPFDGTTLHGDLGIKGYGDPFLVVEEFWNLLRGLRRLGLREIEGDLLLDDSYFEVPPEDPGAFDGQPFRTYNVAPSALLANFKAVQFLFLPDTANRRVHVGTDPELANLEIRNRLSLGDGPCNEYQGGISFSIEDPETNARVVLEGEFPASCGTYSLSRTVLQHDTYLYGMFGSLWSDLGGTQLGRLASGPIPAEANLVWTWQSPPLAEVIRSINKNSNNVMTRQLVLTIAAEQGELPGTEVRGGELVAEFLRSRNLHDGSLVLANGAGLSREGRVSARMLVDILEAAAKGPYAPEFMASLSIAGLDGTTRGRFDEDSGNGVMHVKSGRLDHVSALAGYAHADDGGVYALAILMNATDAHRGLGQDFEEAVMQWLQTQL